MLACTMEDWRFCRYKQEHGEVICEEYDSCEECPYYNEYHAEEVTDV